MNHNGDLGLALRLVDGAAEAGCDAVKFQTFKAERLVSRSAAKTTYPRAATQEESQLEMLRRLELPPDAFWALQSRCLGWGVQFISSPFDSESVDLLSELGVPVFKIPSGEITNFPVLEHIARQAKPIILSTGMSYLAEVEEALEVLRTAGAREITLLHCTSACPAEPCDANFRAMLTLRRAFDLAVGYSDHTSGIEVAIAAVVPRAVIIEKHFTLDRFLPGPDHRALLEPHELKALVSAIRTVERAPGGRRQAAGEEDLRAVARRRIVAACYLPAGTVLTADHLALKRPGTGLPPGWLPLLVGSTLKRDISADELITMDAVG